MYLKNRKMNESYVKVKMDGYDMVKRLKLDEKLIILEKNVFRSEDLIKTNNPLWGWYPVKSFIINEKEIDVLNEAYICGDAFEGECYIKRSR